MWQLTGTRQHECICFHCLDTWHLSVRHCFHILKLDFIILNWSVVKSREWYVPLASTCDWACWQSHASPAQANGKLPTDLGVVGLPHTTICSRERCVGLLLQPRRRKTTSPLVIWLRGEFACWHPSTELASLGGCTVLPASGLTSQADHFRAFHITTAAGTSADLDRVFFLSLTKIVLVNDCQRSVLQPAASPKDSHKA